tara:strand:- start:9957 stop:10667 length:711 start_codon:yes stop_codon:yes gene_type:complete
MANLLSIIEVFEQKMNIDQQEDGTLLPGKRCLDELFTIEEDNSVNQNKMNSFVHLYELGDPNNIEELKYVESKLIKLVLTDAYDISECFSLYTFTQNICEKGLSNELIALLGDLLDMDTDTGDNGDFENNLKIVEHRLGKYVPDIIKKLIEVSELYEKKSCGTISKNTHVLKKLYSRIIKEDAGYEEYNLPGFDIGEFFESFQTNILTKTILLIFLGYLISKVIGLLNVHYNVNDK